MIFSLLLVGSLLSSFSIFVRAYFPIEGENQCPTIAVAPMAERVYICLLMLFIIMTILKPLERSRAAYLISSILFGLLFYFMLAIGVLYVISNVSLFGVIFLSSLVASYIIPVVFNCSLVNWPKYFCGTIALLFLTPTYFNLFMIYSISNLHDVSWGTREGGDSQGKALMRLKSFRAWWFVIWLFINMVYAYLVILFNN